MGLGGDRLAQAQEGRAGAQAQEGQAIDERGRGGVGHEADLGAEGAPAKAGLRLARDVAGQVVRRVVAGIYPPGCLACEAPTDEAHGLCGSCWAEAGFLAGALVCDQCGVPLPGVGVEGDVDLCDECLRRPKPWDRGRAVMPYPGTGKRLVLAFKRGDRTDLARPLGRWMAQAAGPLVRNGEAPVLVPVPVHWTRLFGRRYNQAALLARHAGRAMSARVLPDALVRPRRTASLGHLGAAERATTLDGAIAPHPRRGRLLAGRPVILVDDVMTSGATLRACTAAAREAGAASVSVLVLARAGRGDVA